MLSEKKLTNIWEWIFAKSVGQPTIRKIKGSENVTNWRKNIYCKESILRQYIIGYIGWWNTILNNGASVNSQLILPNVSLDKSWWPVKIKKFTQLDLVFAWWKPVTLRTFHVQKLVDHLWINIQINLRGRSDLANPFLLSTATRSSSLWNMVHGL